MTSAPLPSNSEPVPFEPAADLARLLIELEVRQDDLLCQLEELNRRIEQAIVMGQIGIRQAENIELPAMVDGKQQAA